MFSDWSTLIETYVPEKIVVMLSYEQGMNVAHDIFLRDHRHDEVINYAIDMFNAIRDRYPEKWNQDWNNDLYVNILCEIVLRYSEIYESYKRIYKRLLPDPPAHVLFSLAMYYFLPPEVETILQNEAIKLFKRAIEKELTHEAAFSLRDIYERRNDEANFRH